MLRLPEFDMVLPDTLEQAVLALARPGARIVAGGTDIVPNLKHRLDTPAVLVSLARIPGLETVTRDETMGMLRIGAGIRLTQLADHTDVARLFPSLGHPASVVASPLIRNMGTLGGNVNLDTRCRYVNQTEFWRGAIGGCLKAEGDVCHVVPGGRNCVAAMSSDCAPVLISLDAHIVLVSRDAERVLPLADYYCADGIRHTVRRDDEITTEIRVPLPRTAMRTSYVKWSVRKSIDFPLVSVALRFDLDADRPSAHITATKVVVGVLGAKPRIVGELGIVSGRSLDDPEVADIVAEQCFKQCKPLENVPYQASYRRKLIRTLTRRAIQALANGTLPTSGKHA